MKKMIMALILTSFMFLMSDHTKNSDNPLKGNWDFSMKKLWEIENAGENVLGEIQNIKTSEDGRIYIVDSKNFLIYIFNKDGKFISSFGRKGEGPGEIKTFRSGEQLFIKDKNLLYVDRGRLHYFTLNGEYKQSKIISTQMRPRTFVSDNIFISAPVVVQYQKEKIAQIKLFDMKDKKERIIAQYIPFEKASHSEESGGQRMTVAIVFSDITPLMFVKYRNGRIYYGMSNTYQINICDLNGKEVSSFSLIGRKQKKVSDSFKKKVEGELGDVPHDMVKKILNSLPANASFFQDFFIDKSGLIYVFISDPDSQTSQDIDVFSAEGKYIYSSKLLIEKSHSIQNIHFYDRNVIMVIEDEDGNIKIAKYSIQMPNE